MDVVYVVRARERNPELRFSLRSLVHLPHGRVWVAGYKPSWVDNVEYLPTKQTQSKYENSTGNLLTAVAQDDLSDEFVYMNDDFFILHPLEGVPVLHRGPVAEVNTPRNSPYRRGKDETAALLESWGIADPLSYELHMPMVLHKKRLREVLVRAMSDARITALHKRTVYGNYWQVGGVRVDDCKIHNKTSTFTEDQMFVSTSESSFRGSVGRDIRNLFPDPSPYEKEIEL